MPLVEREAMLAHLDERLAEARSGQGRLVTVSGEAGIGKTALLDAFSARLPRSLRVLRGSCDPVTPGRPFAPIMDIAAQVGDGLQNALANADRDLVFQRFVSLVRGLAPGSVVILEDLHWADSATLDLLRVVGRRLVDLPVLLLGSFRSHDVDGTHPLRLALGDIPARQVTGLYLPPLTVAGVRALVSGTAMDPARLHASTGGNPFFVTEVVAAGGNSLPTTVRDAVGTRLGRLSPEAQAVMRTAAVLGLRVERPLLMSVAEGPVAAAGLGECLAREMLLEQSGFLSFRHELARLAVLDLIGPTERVHLHARALAALRSGVAPADIVRLAQHAIGAGDSRAIASLAPQAAAHAAGLGAHGEAADYYAVSLAPSDVEPRTRGELLERYAYECSVSDRVAAARSAQQAALTIWRELGDGLREGDGLRALSTYMWLAGEGDRAREVAETAVQTLEPILPHGHEMAYALANVAQRRLVATQDDEATAAWAERALDLAEALADEVVAVHALTTLAVAEIYLRLPSGWARLEDALQRAKSAGLSDATSRALINFVEAARDLRRYDLADKYVDEALAFLRDHEFDLYRHMLSSRIAELALERGRWGLAEKESLELLGETAQSNQVRVRALEVIGRLRARRGEPGAWAALDEGMRIVGPGELQEICPLHAARAEAAWLNGDLDRAGEEATIGIRLAARADAVWWLSELSFWAWRAGRIDHLPDGVDDAYALHVSGRHREAALAWQVIGCPYQQAAALADSNREDDLREALAILHSLGARVLATRVTQRLKELGVRGIARGPRATTRSNPAGLSSRQIEVLRLIRDGARNAEIAERLFVSPKTVDHHVSAILRKLGVSDREGARREADRLGVKDGGLIRPN